MSALFCRHNRFTADCPICAKGTVLDTSAPAAPRRARDSGATGARPKGRRGSAAPARYPVAEVGPYEDLDGVAHRVRLERVLGGLRLAAWTGDALVRRAPRLPAADLPVLLARAGERAVVTPAEAEARDGALRGGEAPPTAPGLGSSPGRAGDLQDELRAELEEDGLTLRVARWVLRPGRGWEMQDAPTMLPAARYAEAFAGLRG